MATESQGLGAAAGRASGGRAAARAVGGDPAARDMQIKVVGRPVRVYSNFLSLKTEHCLATIERLQLSAERSVAPVPQSA